MMEAPRPWPPQGPVVHTDVKVFINHPIVAIVIAILLDHCRSGPLLPLPTSQFPDIVPPPVQTSATYTGADALTVEQSVATPIEEQ